MYSVIDSMAMLTASFHIRSSGQDGSATTDELKEFGQQVGWQDAVLDYANHYARKVIADYNAFSRDCKGYGLAKNAKKIARKGMAQV